MMKILIMIWKLNLKNKRKLEKKEDEIQKIIYLKKIKKHFYQTAFKLIIKHPFQIVKI